MRRTVLRHLVPVLLIATLLSGCTFVNFAGFDTGMVFGAAMLMEFPLLAGRNTLVWTMILPFIFELDGVLILGCNIQLPPGTTQVPRKLRVQADVMSDEGQLLTRYRRKMPLTRNGDILQCAERRIHFSQWVAPKETHFSLFFKSIGAQVPTNSVVEWQMQYLANANRSEAE